MGTRRSVHPQIGGDGRMKNEETRNGNYSYSDADRYDLEVRRTRISSSNDTVEYFTNGVTTLLFGQSSPKRLLTQTAASSSCTMATAGIGTLPHTKSKSTMTKRYQQQNQLPPKQETTANCVIKNSLIAGSIAGVCSTAICYPFEMLRVKIQQAPIHPHAVAAAASHSGGGVILSTSVASTAVSNGGAGTAGLAGTIRYTLHYGGIRAFYAGMSLPLAAQAFYKATVWTVNNLTHHALVDWKTRENYKLGIFQPYQVTLADNFFCGFMGGAVNGAVFVTPVEFVRNQVISQQQYGLASKPLSKSKHGRKAPSPPAVNRRIGVISIIRSTLHTDGMIGFWRGLVPTVIRDSVGCGCFFVSMAYSKQVLQGMQDRHDPSSSPLSERPSTTTVMLSGGLAGLAFWLWSLPLDTMKTWIQDGKARDLRCAFELSQRNGFRNSIPLLFRGWQVAYGRGIPAAMISVTGFTYMYDTLNES